MSGRPSSFTPEFGDLICSLIAEGKSLRKVCLLDGMPHISTVLDWVMKGTRGDERYAHFAEQYTHAMDLRTEYWAEEIIDVSDDGSDDALFTEDGKRVMNSEFVQRSKLKVESRKWLMGKLKPKKYGDRQQIDMDATVKLESLTDDQLDTQLTALAAEAGVGLALGGEGEAEA